jgi:membrane protein implicated in regulation of membrane protease activity
MKLSDLFLLCFAAGTLWSVATLLLGGLHVGHGSHGGHPGAIHPGHGANVRMQGGGSHFAALLNPSSLAIFFAWFGGVGFVLTRHTGMAFWVDIAVAGSLGLLGAYLLAAFLRFLQAHEQPLNRSDYEIVGTLGRVSSTIRPDGVGELIYTRDGARRPVCARSEDGSLIGRDTEVVVTRYEKGVAYVRTFDSMLTRRDSVGSIEN